MTSEIVSTISLASGRRGKEPKGANPLRGTRHRLVRMIPLAPAIVLMAVFLLGPIIWSFYGSFTNAALTGPHANHVDFIGFANYQKLFADPVFPLSVGLTVIFVLGSAVITQTTLGLGLALVMQRANKALSAVVGTVVVTAWVLPEIVAAFVSYAYFSKDGTLNQLLAGIGIPAINWLYSYPMVAICLANVWRGTAFSMMIYQAALNDVPPEITEAAEIDGAGGFKRLWFVTIPMIKQTINTTLMLITLSTLSVFTLIYVMTSGGPGNLSTTLPIFAYKEAFKFSDIGYGTAIATVMLIVGAVFSIFYIRALRPEKD